MDKTVTQNLILKNIKRLNNSEMGNPNFKLTFESKALKFVTEVFTQDDYQINYIIDHGIVDIDDLCKVTFKADGEKKNLLLEDIRRHPSIN